MSLFRQYGASKIGSGQLVSCSGSAWTEIVLSTLVTGGLPQRLSFVIIPEGVVYVAQANHALTIAGAVQTLPADPVATPGAGPGYFSLQAQVPWRVDVERPGENSLWIWAASTTLVRVVQITGTDFDD